MFSALAAAMDVQYLLEGAGERAASGHSTVYLWQLLGECSLLPSGEMGGSRTLQLPHPALCLLVRVTFQASRRDD